MPSTYRPKRAPGRRVKHASNPRKAFLVNSKQGSVQAVREHYRWADNDQHLTKPGADGVPHFVNGHGNPERTWGRTKFEARTWEHLSTLAVMHNGHKYVLRTGGQTLHQNAALGLNTEFEVKDVHPLQHHLAAAFKRLAVEAEAAYGANWRAHVVVKVLTNLSGGVPYALQVCRAAHAAGFQTMILARGRARGRTFAGETSVTWVRGSLVIR